MQFRNLLFAVVFSLIAATGAYAQTSDHPPEVLSLPLPSEMPTEPPNCVNLDPGSQSGTTVQLERTFIDDFDTSSLSPSLWKTHLPGPEQKFENRTLANNSEQQLYVDPNFAGNDMVPLGINPFHFNNSTLTITAQRTPPSRLKQLRNYAFTSGLISTHDSFKQAFGYFEIRAKLPRGKALWPAFWLVRPNWEWPPELDVLEAMDSGDHPERVSMSVHWKENGNGAHKGTGCNVIVDDDTKNFHTYGMLWTKERIVLYLDRKPVGQLVTPPGLDQSRPMYLLANLAIQKTADDKTPASSNYDIDWITAYQLKY